MNVLNGISYKFKLGKIFFNNILILPFFEKESGKIPFPISSITPNLNHLSNIKHSNYLINIDQSKNFHTCLISAYPLNTFKNISNRSLCVYKNSMMWTFPHAWWLNWQSEKFFSFTIFQPFSIIIFIRQVTCLCLFQCSFSPSNYKNLLVNALKKYPKSEWGSKWIQINYNVGSTLTKNKNMDGGEIGSETLIMYGFCD